MIKATKTVNTKKSEYDAAVKDLEAKTADYEAAIEEYNTKKAEYDTVLQEYETAKIQYDKTVSDYNLMAHYLDVLDHPIRSRKDGEHQNITIYELSELIPTSSSTKSKYVSELVIDQIRSYICSKMRAAETNMNTSKSKYDQAETNLKNKQAELEASPFWSSSSSSTINEYNTVLINYLDKKSEYMQALDDYNSKQESLKHAQEVLYSVQP